MTRTRFAMVAFVVLSVLVWCPLAVSAAGDDAALYAAYQDSLAAVDNEADLAEHGFRAVESQTFDVEHGQLGTFNLIPAIHEEYGRLALFFAEEDGAIALRTDDFLANSWRKGELRQANRDVICISCVDLTGDGLVEIIVISACGDENYHVGDVLFQNETGFYRDPRVSDKINRFDMNKSAEDISAFIQDGNSMEFLFVAKTLDELLAGGFKPINYLRTSDHLEKFGVVEVVPGYYSMTGQYYLMVYIVDESGNILWDFQPMHHYENFYNVRALSLRDIDGDGNKDILLLVRYVESGSRLKTDYDIYYQRAGYFLEDTEFKRSYACGETDDIDSITEKARQYWRWPQ